MLRTTDSAWSHLLCTLTVAALLVGTYPPTARADDVTGSGSGDTATISTAKHDSRSGKAQSSKHKGTITVVNVHPPRPYVQPQVFSSRFNSFYVDYFGDLAPTPQNFRWLLNWKPAAAKPGKKPAAPAPVVSVPTVSEVVRTYFASTTIPGAGLHIQPPKGIMYCDKPVIAYTTNHTYETTLNVGGMDIPVRADAREYTYTWGDGQTLTTTRPGRPYPAFDVTHTYACPASQDAPGWRVDIALTTSWKAIFMDPTTGVWEDIPEMLTTTETHPQRELGKLHTYLIDPDHQPK